MHVTQQTLRLGEPLRCREFKQPPSLGKVYRPAFASAVHAAEPILRYGVALRCSKPKQPPCLSIVYRPAVADVVHAAELKLRPRAALCCSEPIQPPRLRKVFRPAFADAVHVAEPALRLGVALLCSKRKLAPFDLAILTRVAHSVPDERRELRARCLPGERRARARNFWVVTEGRKELLLEYTKEIPHPTQYNPSG